jgi:hypothetical protein
MDHTGSSEAALAVPPARALGAFLPSEWSKKLQMNKADQKEHSS